jgi:hypothetical protein
MSKRKRYRKLRNAQIKDNIKAFAANRRQKSDERKDQARKDELLKARFLYETFKKELCSEGARADIVFQKIEAFKKLLKETVKDPYTRRTILAEVNMAEIKFLAVYGRSGRTPPQPPGNPSAN